LGDRRFTKKTPVTAHLSGPSSRGNGQAAVHFPMRSGDELALSFATKEELPDKKSLTADE
jgi:hypothetical protein